MKTYLLKIILIVLITTFIIDDIIPQVIYNSKIRSEYSNQVEPSKILLHKSEIANPTLPLAIGILSIFYFVNPIILYEDEKVSAGLTKELSLGFGNFGEYRIGFEYSLIFRSYQKSHIRLSVKYDNLIDNIEPSNMLQETSVLSIGGGYFTDFEGHGFFPEISYGYSIRNDKLLFYPHLKVRYTVMTEKSKSNITDVSFGIVIGFANPFIDLKIRQKH
ncbi:MAG: hypothetical protein ISS16_01530 [Ignavibacteria bacterium]|nr:hypothetical protein [Ignavibacteria bacterium]